MFKAIVNFVRARLAEAAFEEGFFGEAFAKFDTLGPQIVQRLFVNGQISDEIERNAAPIWLRRKARVNLGHVLAALELVVLILTLVVTVLK